MSIVKLLTEECIGVFYPSGSCAVDYSLSMIKFYTILTIVQDATISIN